MHSVGNPVDTGTPEKMSENQETRSERVARYKEERRRQLAAQFNSRFDSSFSSPKTRNKDAGTSSSSEGPRPTRASRLRLAALSQDNVSSQSQGVRMLTPEKSPTSPTVSGTDVVAARTPGSRRLVERDKSSKRKSNLNRSLTSEEVPPSECSDDSKLRRRRRRFFPPEVLELSSPKTTEEGTSQPESNLTATCLSPSPITASSPTQRLSVRKSELSVHMENARRSVTPSFADTGRYKPFAKRERPVTSSPKPSSSRRVFTEPAQSTSTARLSSGKEPSSFGADGEKSRHIANRMEELCALTKQTLARVERLTNRNNESAKKESIRRPVTSSPIKSESKAPSRNVRKSPANERTGPSSILKKKSLEEPLAPIVVETTTSMVAGPVSILKRKVSQDDHKLEGASHSSNHTPPVTFSPSVIEPSSSKRKQGILKKRRSLDESTVMRHRSCSPDVAWKGDSRSILKNQRRSSLEELRRTQSPETQLQGILKRKSSRADEEDQSLNSPQGILKRKSGASSAGSTSNTPHVSITTAVILAAARGAEMVLPPDAEPMRPILKKKSLSEDYSSYSDAPMEVPRPILKKKSSTDTDDAEEKPRPILKLPKSSMERETLDTGQEARSFKHASCNENESEMRPILKSSASREEPPPRPRLSFCGEGSIDEDMMRQRTSRRSNTICSSDFNVNSFKISTKEEDRLLRKPRPLSVHELVMSFEKTCSTGAIPKRSSLKRNSDRYRTQPVTSVELEESRNLVKTPHFKQELPKVNSSLSSRSLDLNSLLEFTSSLENDNNLNSYFSSPLRNPTSPESFVCGKMSSDSAFQSLGDGLELEQDDESSQSVASAETTKTKIKLEPTKLESQMKAIAEEAKNMKLGKGNAGIDRYRSRKLGNSDRFPARFSTQPVTFEEVQEASRVKKDTEDESGDNHEPANLSLIERIQMFERTPAKKRHCRARFSTEIVTASAIASARSFFDRSPFAALDDIESEKSSERKSILKSTLDPPPLPFPLKPTAPSAVAPKSALKKRDSLTGSLGLKKSILKTETSSPDKDDEGISCNDSASDSDSSGEAKSPKAGGAKVTDSTSEGESSGGREVRSIFKNDTRLGFKLALENCLSKSKSQGVVRNDSAYLSPSKKKVTVRRSHTQNEMPSSIADLRAKLQERGTEWRRRVPQNNATDELKLLTEKNRYNDELSEKSLLAAKKDELDASAAQWKARVEKSDAEQFSVAGKMSEKIRLAVPTINIPDAEESEKKTPQAKRFKLKEGAESTPTSPEKGGIFDLTRSRSVPYSSLSDYDLSGSESPYKSSPKRVSVPSPDDFTFQTFFKSVEHSTNSEGVDLSQQDFDAVGRQSLLVIRKNVQVQKRRVATRNPIKALATRTDITNEYTEVITGVAEREKKRLNIEKLAKNSNKAMEALAGLASNEDFKSIALKKSPTTIALLPWKDLMMLLQIKGRRHVQTRLIEPVAGNVNEGDSFVLITPKALYNYVGQYSNVIEQSRAADIANHIRKTGDMGCKVDRVLNITNKGSSPKHTAEFWEHLGSQGPPDIVGAGHPNEDETYELNILRTNMVYSLDGDELVPHDKYWGAIPKIEILTETNILVFDFGSEMYVWSGKNASIQKKRLVLKLAKEMWEDGYNYTDCNICPLNVASMLGMREQEELPRKSCKRPSWALFAKITQHRETVLFREKFLDWPDYSRVIRVKSDDDIREVNASYDIRPCDVDEMLAEKEKDPDLVIENNTHLGRGDRFWDEERHLLFEYETVQIKGWRILENTYEELKEKSLGQFYDGDSYIYRWDFKQNVKGRELSGNPSKKAAVGRDRCIFFCWQGAHSSVNERGTAACLTVELDKQSAPQIRVEQGLEPAAFMKLFSGSMVIHKGKRDETEDEEKPRLFIVRGEVEDEIYLMEVPLDLSSLRSRSSFVIINTETEQVIVWHGSKSSRQKKKVIKTAIENLMRIKPAELYLDEFEEDLDVVEMDEGSESEDFFDILGNDRSKYLSLLNSGESYDNTLRLYRLSSVTGTFKVTEILCLHRSEHSSPYPFVQNELYSASQPALFLLDNHHELWLWQGWWPEKEEETNLLSDQTGSGAVRWQAERRAAMQTAVNYWRKKHREDEEPVKGYLVWAGLEPLEFRSLFPDWEEKGDVKELNMKEGKKPDGMLPLERQLVLLSRSTYPLADLINRPLPEGVDPTNIEKYLSPEDFQEMFLMAKEEFDQLPSWKKTALKKEKGLF